MVSDRRNMLEVLGLETHVGVLPVQVGALTICRFLRGSKKAITSEQLTAYSLTRLSPYAMEKVFY